MKRLTAWQVRELYLRPAAEQAERLRREAGAPLADAPKPHDWTKGLPPRDEFVADRMREQAGGGVAGPPKAAAEWAAMWDEMAAKLKAHQGG